MIRNATLLCLLVAVAGGGLMFTVAHEAQQRERELTRLNREIREARESIAVLEAEWAYLNQLDRLQRLAVRHLGLVPLTPDRVVDFEDLPVRTPRPAPDLVAARPAAPARALPRSTGDRAR